MDIKQRKQNILQAILQKIGKNYETLTFDERITFDRWEKAFEIMGKPVTPQSILEFLKIEKEMTIKDLVSKNIKLNTEIDISLKDRIRIYDVLITFIESPEKAIKSFEAYLKNLHSIK